VLYGRALVLIHLHGGGYTGGRKNSQALPLIHHLASHSPVAQTPAAGPPLTPAATVEPPRSWSCGWSGTQCAGHKGHHNSKIAGIYCESIF
jgi:hypothetical protein